MDTALNEIANSWWNQQAEEFPGGKIPKEQAADLAIELGQLIDVEEHIALKYAENSGVLASTINPVRQEQPPVIKPEISEGDMDNVVKRKNGEELTGRAKLVWDNLESTGNNTDKLIAVLKKGGYPHVTPGTISTVRNMLRTKGYDIPKAFKGRRKPKAPKTPPIPSITAIPPWQEHHAIRNPEPPVMTRMTSIDEKITEIKAQIAKLQEDLAALERAKRIMES